MPLGLALRVAAIVPYAMGPNTYSDDNGYLTSGITFARTGYIAYAAPGLQTTAIGPGMPLLLGGLIALLGAAPAGLVAAHIVFSCIGLLTAIAAYLLGELLCSRTAGLIAAGLCVLEPALLSVNIVFLTETPYMCLNLFAIYFLLASVREWRWGRYWAGVLCISALRASPAPAGAAGAAPGSLSGHRRADEPDHLFAEGEHPRHLAPGGACCPGGTERREHMNYFWAFVTGGAICVVGQLFLDLTALTPARILTGYVVAGVVLSALGWYAPLAEFTGCGATVPLLGFGHLLAKGVRTALQEEGAIGILTGGLTAAAAGVTTSLVCGVVCSWFGKSHDQN